MSNAYDAIIVGTGQAGAPLAGRLSEAGMKVAIVERKLFGGTCVKTGCTPTKTLVASAYAAHLTRRAADFGVVINGQVGVDMKKVKARKDAVSGQSQKNVESWLRQLQNCTVYQGRPRPFHISHRDERRNDAANGDAHIHQCWGTCSNASDARA
jgi:pyruvate/2-oxoglutarate dehydrogenase complex dihydrolipoamide dehydrogenase (E3) component